MSFQQGYMNRNMFIINKKFVQSLYLFHRHGARLIQNALNAAVTVRRGARVGGLPDSGPASYLG